jgi:hypothetical protein
VGGADAPYPGDPEVAASRLRSGTHAAVEVATVADALSKWTNTKQISHFVLYI